MLEVEVIGLDDGVVDELTALDVEELCMLAFSSAGIEDGHVAVAFVDEQTIQTLNRDHRGKDAPTDVLSFPIDGIDPDVPAQRSNGAPRELGDVVICPPCTEDLSEAVVHGVLHLTGMDHEVDDGEMLALQAELLRWVQE
jgi:probable rRNA maturation factor